MDSKSSSGESFIDKAKNFVMGNLIVVGIVAGVLVVGLICLIIGVVSAGKKPEELYGAYKSVPDSNYFEYRFGNGLGGPGNGWDDAKLSILSSTIGIDSQRKKLPESHLQYWGYEIEVGDCKTNEEHDILQNVGFLATPSDEHCSSEQKGWQCEFSYPLNLYEPIFLLNGTVNPNNYWANYVYKTVSIYKPYIRIWETWNEPDYLRDAGIAEKWWKEVNLFLNNNFLK